MVLFPLPDGPGQEATEKFREEYAQKGYTVSTRTPAHGKDWNEYLQQRGRAKERGDQRQARPDNIIIQA